MWCYAPLCKTTADTVSRSAGVTLHKFPSDPHLRAAWLRALGRQDTPLPDSAGVCSQHFLHDEFYETEFGSRIICDGVIPSTVQVCMICLDTDTKLYHMNTYELEEEYQHLTGNPPCDLRNLKQTLCVNCAQILFNFSRFRGKSLRARALLMDLVQQHELITRVHIKKINRTRHQLISNMAATTLAPYNLLLLEEIDSDSEDTIDTDEENTEANDELMSAAQQRSDDPQALSDYPGPSGFLPPTSVALPANNEPEAPPAEEDASHDEQDVCASGAPVEDVGCLASATSQNEVPATLSNPTGELLTCSFCEFTCSENDNLVRHMRAHPAHKPFACELCKYKCSKMSYLARHMRTHTGKKPYCCDLCKYKCSQKCSLVRHMRTHTGEKPYYCELCKYKCSQNSNLVIHMRTHLGEKPYRCKLCEYKCSQNSSLVNHMRTHTGEKPYYCELCKYKCSQKSNLVIHMRTHLGEKPYRCKLCDYKSSQHGNLVRHTRTHTGDKLYSCDLCEYKCSNGASLVSHMRTHHPSCSRSADRSARH